MKADAIMKAIELAKGRGMAEETLGDLPDGGKPADLPVIPETDAMGPPAETPPVDTGEKPLFDDMTGLPVIVIDKLPESFRSGEDDESDDDFEMIF